MSQLPFHLCRRKTNRGPPRIRMSGRQKRLRYLSHAKVRGDRHALYIYGSPHTGCKSWGDLPGLNDVPVFVIPLDKFPPSTFQMDRAISFAHQVKMVGVDISKAGSLARRPADLEFVYLSGITQPKM